MAPADDKNKRLGLKIGENSLLGKSCFSLVSTIQMLLSLLQHAGSLLFIVLSRNINERLPIEDEEERHGQVEMAPKLEDQQNYKSVRLL